MYLSDNPILSRLSGLLLPGRRDSVLKMSDSDKPALPYGADTLIPIGGCSDGREHVLALKDGVPVAATHVRRVTDGQPLPDGELFWVDSNTGRVVDSMRIGNGPAQVATPAYRQGWDAVFGKSN